VVGVPGDVVEPMPMMTLGAVTFSFVGTGHGGAVWNSANPFEAFTGSSVLPHRFVVIFFVVAIVQLFGINFF
jgi:hypothetical protein